MAFSKLLVNLYKQNPLVIITFIGLCMNAAGEEHIA